MQLLLIVRQAKNITECFVNSFRIIIISWKLLFDFSFQQLLRMACRNYPRWSENLAASLELLGFSNTSMSCQAYEDVKSWRFTKCQQHSFNPPDAHNRLVSSLVQMALRSDCYTEILPLQWSVGNYVLLLSHRPALAWTCHVGKYAVGQAVQCLTTHWLQLIQARLTNINF